MSRMAELHMEAQLEGIDDDMDYSGAGHNQPPETIDFAHETMRALSDWMKDRPVIENEDDAREAKLLLDRAKNIAGELEAERDKLVRPLNDKIDTINAKYKTVHNKDTKKPGLLDRVVNELKARLSAFLQAEEDRRIAAAEAAQRARDEAERVAREAEQREREAIDNAAKGELGVDVTQVVVEADNRFAEFQKADREAARAERDSHVKLGGGFGRAAALRTKETLVLVSYAKAIKTIGPNEKIREAILSAARDYRKEKGYLPEGVEAELARAL